MVRVREWALMLGLALQAAGCGETERKPPFALELGGTSSGNSLAGQTNAETGQGGGSGTGGTGDSGTSGAGTSGAGTSGAGTTLSEGIAECEQYCKTLPYLLPQALCEDWHHEGWDPEFCHIATSSECSEYCPNIYNGVSPVCAATLPAAIRCVSHTYEHAGTLPDLGQCWLKDCRDPLYTMTSACYGLGQKLAAARATWSASGITDYQLSYDLSADHKATVAVHAGAQPVVAPSDATAWTVPQLFDQVELLLHTPATAPRAVYDDKLGYVVLLAGEKGCDITAGIVSGVQVTPLP